MGTGVESVHNSGRLRTRIRPSIASTHHITDRSKPPGGDGITVCEQPCHPQVERSHASDGADWHEGLHPDNLYALIGTGPDEALLERGAGR